MPIIISEPLAVGDGLDLCAVWLNAAADLADVEAFRRLGGDQLAATASVRAEVRQLVGRRRVVVTDAAIYEQFSLTLETVTADQLDWLNSHVGQILCLRDPYGSKLYVIYTEAPREVPTGYPERTSVKLTLEQVTHSEAVG